VRNHLIKRGNKYHFVCRIPQDLLHHFPSSQISHSLKTDKNKDAAVLAASLEYQTQKLFTQLRTGMLPKDLEKRLVALYLNSFVTALRADAKGQKFGRTKRDDTGVSAIFDLCANAHTEWDSYKDRAAIRSGMTAQDIRNDKLNTATEFTEIYGNALADKNPSLELHTVSRVATLLKKKLGIKMTPANCKTLSMELTHANKIIHEVDAARVQGNWTPLELLEEKVERELATPFHYFETVLEKYREYYLNKNPNVAPGTKDDMDVECRVLLEIIGNISIAEVNTLDTVTKLKSVLRKYPLNKQQRYGDRSILSIIRTEKEYVPISPKTANEYIKRLKRVIDYANKAKMINASNVAENELFPTTEAAEEQRDAYDSADIERLINAICKQQLWTYGDPKPERFWIILIALFHGFRLGNIVALTKADICQTDKGTWIFQLRKGKTKSTVRPVAICDSLLLLGFLEWAEGLKRVKLFQDSSDSFSKWYNRSEERKGKHGAYLVKGFEASHITESKKKCLYSLRHSFAENVFDVSSDYKITADMMGHSTGTSVTARYTKKTKAETLKSINEKMDIDKIDLDLLEARSIELFRQ